MPQQGAYKLSEAKPIGAYSLTDVTPADQAPEQQGGLAHAAEEFWKRANPITWAEGLYEAAKHPVGSAVNMVRADPQFLVQAKDAAGKGDYLTATRKVLSYLSMGLGHDLDAQADMGAKGDLSGMVGAMGGTAAQFLAPEAAARLVTAAPALRVAPANPAVQEAVQFGQRAGVPLDAATATDNAAVRAVQHLSDRSLGGAQVAGRKVQQQAQGLASVGEQLAAKGYARPMSPEGAGQGVRDALESKIGALDAEADTQYGRLRDIGKQSQETVQTSAPTPAPADAAPRFTTKPNVLPDELFEHVYADARKNGYQGSKGSLRVKFDEQLKSGFDGIKESEGGAAELGPETLLKDIRQYGGLKPFDKESGVKYRGEYESIQQGFNSQTSGWHQRGAAQIFRNEGLSLDGMVEALRQDPKWAGMIESTNDLLDVLNDVARSGPTASMGKATAQDALAITDIKPGSQWWIPRTEEVQAMPVDLRAFREQAAPMYQGLLRERELNGLMLGDKSRALIALDKLMTGADYAPLDVVDKALSDIKALARGNGGLAALRTDGQGVAAQAVKFLDGEVRKAAEAAGPGAIEALESGRYATRAKYAVAKVYDAIKEEPVKAFNQAISPNDTAINALRDVAEHAPDELPKIGRAYLDGLLDKATAEGGFTRADRLFADWQKLGPETKKMLFQDPAYVKELDHFFLLAKQINRNANPSGTAHTAAMLAQGSQLFHPLQLAATVAGTAGLSAFLHSPAGVKLLTDGLRLPASPAVRAAWVAKLKAYGAAQGSVLTSQSAGAGPGG